MAAAALSLMTLVGCSSPQNNPPMCATNKSLLRFDTQQAPSITANEKFYSNGGFIEVYTRKEMFGPVDSFRTCTAYAEFADNPLAPEADILSAPVFVNVYTSAHCVDLSNDHSLKLFLFDGSKGAYFPFMVKLPALEKMQSLRAAMKQKSLSQDQQRKVLSAFRNNPANLEDLFNQPLMASTTTGSGVSENAAQLCLKKDDPKFQKVCSTHQDLIALKLLPLSDAGDPAVEVLKELRKNSAKRLRDWIAETKLSQRFADPKFKMFFTDEKASLLGLEDVHKQMRARVDAYSKFKMLKYVHDVLLPPVSSCSGSSSEICAVLPEIADVVRTTLVDTKYSSFEVSKLQSVIDIIKSEFTVAQNRMNSVFTLFEPLIVKDSSGNLSLPFETRLHSNFRFVTESAPTKDVPDPRDTVRAFMNINMNNVTGDVSGGGVKFIPWNPETQSGHFNFMEISRIITDEMKEKAAEKEAETKKPTRAQVGFLQPGDSGSIVAIEYLPYFAVTSVDGVSTSGGASIRPLPEPFEEDQKKMVDTSDAKVRTSVAKICK